MYVTLTLFLYLCYLCSIFATLYIGVKARHLPMAAKARNATFKADAERASALGMPTLGSEWLIVAQSGMAGTGR